MTLQERPFNGGRTSPGHARNSSGDVELTFRRHPFESLDGTFDPILAIIAIGRQPSDHFVGAGGGQTGDTDGPANSGLTETPPKASMMPSFLASRSGHRKYTDYTGFSMR
jgi:hypothetical protein